MDSESEMSSSSVETTDDDEPTLDLDINVLQQLASSRLNRNCVRACKLASGNYNEIYLLQFDVGPDCIARLSLESHPEAKFASEVATMKYVAQNTSIKVPEVYDWDCTVHNPIKTPYILTERLPGKNLYRVWNKLTVEKRKSALSQVVDTLLELSKCRFDKIGSLYMSNSKAAMSTFQIGPIVNPLLYIKGRDAIPSSTGPFESMQKFFDVMIQKEKKFFEIYGIQELMKWEEKIDQITAESRVAGLVKQLGLLQSKLSNLFDELIDQKPFVLLQGDFDAQNILVEHSPISDNIKIVGIVDWEFSRTGTLWDLCQYPIWIQVRDPLELLNLDEEEVENQKLRDFFYYEMVAKLGNRSGQMLELRERDRRIEELGEMFTFIIHPFSLLKGLLYGFFHRYGSELKANIKYNDPIMEFCEDLKLIKVQIPSKKTIDDWLSKDKLSNKTKSIVSNVYIASVYFELKSKGYDFSWYQTSTIAFYMWNNERMNSANDV